MILMISETAYHSSRYHAIDAACNLDRLVNVVLGHYEASQLNDTLERFNVDLARFQRSGVKYGVLHFGSDNGVIDILSDHVLRGGRYTSEDRNQCNSKKECSEPLSD